jgi:hypothetical protein
MMLFNRPILLRSFFVITLLSLLPSTGYATQAHAAPEGLYTHQLAHIFFIVSMGSLIFWLKKRHLSDQKGWRYIQYAAACLILWNIGAFTAHALDEQFVLVNVTRLDNWRIEIIPPVNYPGLAPIYYLCKLDHLLCVPALIFLYAGLRQLRKDLPQPAKRERPA